MAKNVIQSVFWLAVLLTLQFSAIKAQENSLAHDVGDGQKQQTALEIHEIVRRAASGVDFRKQNESAATARNENSRSGSLKCAETYSIGNGEKIDSSEKAMENPLICLTVKLQVEMNGEKFPMVSRFGAPEFSPGMRKLKMENKEPTASSVCFPAPPRSPLGIAAKSTTFQVETTEVCVCGVEDFCNDK